MTRPSALALMLTGLSCLPLQSSEAATDTLVVLNKEAASAWLIDPRTGEAHAKLSVGDGPHEAAVSPDGRTAVVANYADGRTLSVVDVVDRKVLRTIDLSPHRRPHGIEYLPDGKHVVVTAEASDRLVKVDVEDGRVVAEYPTGGGVHMVALDPERGRAYATAIGEGFLSVVDLEDPSARPRQVSTGSGTEALALRPGGREIWVGNNSEHTVKIIDTRSFEIVDAIEVGLQPIRLAFTRDGKHALASCIISGDLAVIDADERRITRRVKLSGIVLEEKDWKGKTADEVRPLAERVVREGARPIGVLVDPDGRFAYVANRGLDHIAVIDLGSWEIVRRLPTGKGPDGMAWSRIP